MDFDLGFLNILLNANSKEKLREILRSAFSFEGPGQLAGDELIQMTEECLSLEQSAEAIQLLENIKKFEKNIIIKGINTPPMIETIFPNEFKSKLKKFLVACIQENVEAWSLIHQQQKQQQEQQPQQQPQQQQPQQEQQQQHEKPQQQQQHEKPQQQEQQQHEKPQQQQQQQHEKPQKEQNKEQKSKQKQQQQPNQIFSPELVDFDWSVNLATATSSQSKLNVPICSLQLQLLEPFDNKSQSRVVDLELNLESLDRLLDQLSNITDQLGSFTTATKPPITGPKPKS